MKKIVLIVFVGLLGFALNAQEKVAKIEFDSQTIDYGKIEKGANGVRVFTFTNTGNAPLVISDARSSCGCTIPKKPEKPIAPGEKGEIQVKYDTNRVGPIRKTITVSTNAVDNPNIALKIKGTVFNKSSVQ
ncbi:MAG: DUF1573 domain-containing protein [Flavobacteriaceae bacterium]|nr:DUF1573 domain-containing protein [Flavobacteriaceae bacterium]